MNRRPCNCPIPAPRTTRAQFARLFGFRTAGFFDGTIRVRGSTRVDTRLVATLHHEYTHAALDSIASGSWPAWLNEGLSEYFEARALGRRGLSSSQYATLVRARQGDHWIPLSALSTPSFSHLGGHEASLAYLESYAMIAHLVRRHGDRDLRALVKRIGRTRNAALALKRIYKRSLPELEADLLKELR